MTNPSMPNLPGFGAIAESMEWVRSMWGGANAPGIGIPGMVMPTLSVDEINKQISDLKAVESWLTLNMNMLRGTIQALEVQSATISTLKSMGETLSSSGKAAAEAVKSAAPGFSFPFGTASTPGGWGSPAPETARTAPPPAPAPAPAAAPAPAPAVAESLPDAAGSASPANQGGGSKKPASEKSSAADTGFAAPMANPAAWWNMLQDQFKQAVSTALIPEAGAGEPARKKTASRSDTGSSGGSADAAGGTRSRSAKGASAKPAGKSAAKVATKAPARKG